MSSLGLLARLDPLSVLTCDARGRLASVHLSQHGSQLFVIVLQEKSRIRGVDCDANTYLSHQLHCQLVSVICPLSGPSNACLAYVG